MLVPFQSKLPRGPEWPYEPKFDGLRGLLWRSDIGVVRVLSLNLKELDTSFRSARVPGPRTFPEFSRSYVKLPILDLDTHEPIGNLMIGSVQIDRHSSSLAPCDEYGVCAKFITPRQTR
jgi:hypothetical protein